VTDAKGFCYAFEPSSDLAVEWSNSNNSYY